ncbi:translation initiation factor IF-2 [Roseivirga sp. BDSF3-8]|uniref:translation initiation factor IF-2 n=1 Tax=Roseivirga sp. BDSF3-8 TaxID=3241598 RepID=UPI003531A501
MAEEKMMRLSQVARKLNIGKNTIVEHLATKGFEVEDNPNSKISMEQYNMLAKEFASSAMEKEEASGLTIGKKHAGNVVIDTESDPAQQGKKDEEEEIFIKGINVDKGKAEEEAPKASDHKKEPAKEEKSSEEKDDNKVGSSARLQGIKVVGKIDLDQKGKAKATPQEKKEEKKEEKAPEKPAPQPEAKAEKPAEKPQQPAAKETKEEAKPEPKKEEKKETEGPVKPPQQPEVPKKPEEKPSENKEKKVDAPKQQEKPAAQKQPEAEKKPEVKEKTEAAASAKQKPAEKPAASEGKKQEADSAPKDEKVISAKANQLKGLTVLGKIELPESKSKKKAKPVASSDDRDKKGKKRRKRISKPVDGKGGGGGGGSRPGQQKNDRGAKGRGGARKGKPEKEELSDKEIQEQIKETLAKLSGGGGKKGGRNVSRSKYRRDKRSAAEEAREQQREREEQEAQKLKVTEFISANDLASLMNVSVNEVISTCLSLGLFVSINQRLDAETITVIADEFGYDVEFTSSEDEETVEEIVDDPDTLEERSPIVTIMGHVDHGKTSLLDFIRNTRVTAGEAGGITQHIGAYDVTTDSGKRIAFLDTPGHEAFTAMRARGAKVTDVAIIVVAADDNVMPQTKEAINHAQVANVPIVIAINKVDKPTANADKIREELANMNILVEDWGGKYQCQEISAKTGQGIDDLLEKVLLEAELLELTANPNRGATGTVIEASLDKGRGYVTTILVQSGTLNIGDVMLAGQHYGKVKAMFDHRGKKLEKAGPSTPVLVLGLDGAPQAGDKLQVMETDREARDIANKREQINREQSIRTKKHITLDEIGRRLAIGTFKELNVIVKGDVDGSIEALSDSLLKLSTDEVQVNIIHKAVGQISESDILLASASDAIVVGFQVRPSAGARKLAEQEEIEIRLYSIIYDAINEVKDAMEGMLAPTVEEVIVGNAEVRDIFKISRVGTVAGCYVTDGHIKRNHRIRLIRDGIVVYAGELGALKRFKDDVNEVRQGYECGMSIRNFNDIKEGDVIEAFEEREVKRTL